MDLNWEDYDLKLKDRLDFDRPSTDSFDVTSFLAGAAISMSIIALLIFTGLIGNPFSSPDNVSTKVLPPEEVGNKTVDMLNQRILHNTPNNVTGELVGAKPSDPKTLPNFYEVEIMVKNPASQQITTVYVKKDASLVFLNHPRYFDPEKYRNQEHQ